MKTAMRMLCCLAVLAASSSLAPATVIQIQGSTLSAPSGWNVLSSTTADIADLVDSSGTATGISLTTDDTNCFGTALFYGGPFASGLSAPASDLFGYDNISRTQFFSAWSNADSTVWTFGGLDSETSYTFHFFASWTNNSVYDSYQTRFGLVGETSAHADLEAKSNISQYATVRMTPDASGQIVLTMAAGPGNETDAQTFLLNGLIIDTVPEPMTISLLALGGLGVLVRRPRK